MKKINMVCFSLYILGNDASLPLNNRNICFVTTRYN